MLDYRPLIARLGLDTHKEMRKNIIMMFFAFPFGALLGWFSSWQAGVFALVVGIIMIHLFIGQGYQVALERLELQRVMAFIDAFTIFKIFIKNGYNVYRSIEEAIRYVKPLIREDLLRLLEDIDGDKSVQPYIKFAKRFHPLVVEQLMIGLYQVDIEGGGLGQLEGFDYLFDQFQSQKVADQRRRYDERLDAMNMWPLIGAGLIAINLLIGVVSIIMGAINEL